MFDGSDLTYANLKYADLEGADLRYSQLGSADLTGANLKNVLLSSSGLPLCRGGLQMHIDEPLLQQMLYHVLSLASYSKYISTDTKQLLLTKEYVEYTNQFYAIPLGVVPNLCTIEHARVPINIDIDELTDKISQMKDAGCTRAQIKQWVNSWYGMSVQNIDPDERK